MPQHLIGIQPAWIAVFQQLHLQALVARPQWLHHDESAAGRRLGGQTWPAPVAGEIDGSAEAPATAWLQQFESHRCALSQPA